MSPRGDNNSDLFNDETDIRQNDEESPASKTAAVSNDAIPKKRRCGICMILLFLITVGIISAFLAIGITADGTIIDDITKDIRDITTTFFDDEEMKPGSPEMVASVKKLCSPGNSDKVAAVLEKNEAKKVYVLELLNYGDSSSGAEYLKFLEEDVVPRGQGDAKLVYNFSKESWNLEVPRWTQGIIMEYADGDMYRTAYLEHPDLQAKLTARDNLIRGTPVIMIATLNIDIVTKHPGLIQGPTTPSTSGNTSSGEPHKFLFHLLKYNGANGRDVVEKFDTMTDDLKADNGVHVQAWLDVQATCDKPLSVPAYDQIRIEHVVVDGFAKIVSESAWGEASILRESGLTDESGTGFADYNGVLTNLYQ